MIDELVAFQNTAALCSLGCKCVSEVEGKRISMRETPNFISAFSVVLTNRDSHNPCRVHQECWAHPKHKLQLNFNGENAASHG